ncbi:MAG: hypothetical protein RL535_960, partial [Pseudomonadota bacterium]
MLNILRILLLAPLFSYITSNAGALGGDAAYPPYPDGISTHCVASDEPLYWFVFSWGSNYGGSAYDKPETRGRSYCSALSNYFAYESNRLSPTSFALNSCTDISAGGAWDASVIESGNLTYFSSSTSNLLIFPVCRALHIPLPICPAPESGKLTKNPILPATGEKIKLQTDFTDAAPHGLDFSRTYRTAWGDVTPASGMGSHWNHRFGMQLVSIGTTGLSKTLQMPDGSQRRFTRTATTSAWVNADG